MKVLRWIMTTVLWAILPLQEKYCFGFNEPLNLDNFSYQERTHIIATEIYKPSIFYYELYQMIKDTHEIFEKNQINYWAVAGTLLGAARHKGLIRWDDDGDLGMDYQDSEKLLSLKGIFEDLGYDLSPLPSIGFVIKPNMRFPGWYFGMPLLNLEIFTCEKKLVWL